MVVSEHEPPRPRGLGGPASSGPPTRPGHRPRTPEEHRFGDVVLQRVVSEQLSKRFRLDAPFAHGGVWAGAAPTVGDRQTQVR